MNNAIKETLVDIYSKGLTIFIDKMDKNIAPSIDACEKVFFRIEKGTPEEKFAAWEKAVSEAKREAAKNILGI